MSKMGIELKIHPDIKKTIDEHKDQIISFCNKNNIKKISLFGSALREDFDDESDIDILVWFEPQHKPGFFELVRMEEDLSSILEGREVDLRTPKDLSRYFRDEVLGRSEEIYAQR